MNDNSTQVNNLYIVSTPIGNLQDITLRAANILLTVPVIVTESTSKTGILLDFLEKEFSKKRAENQKIISLTEDEEEQKIPSLLKLISENDTALTSEAGTPLISDPGFKLTREAIKRGLNVVPIPGATAPIAAIAASGLPTDKFAFLGYLPKREGKINEILEKIKVIRDEMNMTVILFESPHRLSETLKRVMNSFGDIDIVLARELTKIHEEFMREKVSNVINYYEKKEPKGEFVILF